MMYLISDELRVALATPPDVVLPAGQIGMRQPAQTSELPAIVVSAQLVPGAGSGIGRTIRGDEVVTRSTSTIDVAPSPTTFNDALDVLRIYPLPLKKNPSSPDHLFTADDVQLSNLTRGVSYRMVSRPEGADEFRLDPRRAEITFGEAQTRGETLELVHWTATWRDMIPLYHYEGTLSLDVWAADAAALDRVSRAAQFKIVTQRGLLRQRGFLTLDAAALEPGALVDWTPTVGSRGTVWKQTIAYRFVFEATPEAEISSGGRIAQIDVGFVESGETLTVS
jgi:hypothetical protein